MLQALRMRVGYLKMMSVVVFVCFSFAVHAKILDLNRLKKEAAVLYLQQSAPAAESSIEKKQKSYGLAIALGFDPIPGDGLIYSGKKVQGGIAMTMGIVGGVLIGTGLAKNCHGSSDYGDCVILNKDFPIVIGASLYGISYLWDGIGSLIAGKKFKQQPSPQSIVHPAPRPELVKWQQSPAPDSRDEVLLKEIEQCSAYPCPTH